LKEQEATSVLSLIPHLEVGRGREKENITKRRELHNKKVRIHKEKKKKIHYRG